VKIKIQEGRIMEAIRHLQSMSSYFFLMPAEEEPKGWFATLAPVVLVATARAAKFRHFRDRKRSLP